MSSEKKVMPAPAAMPVPTAPPLPEQPNPNPGQSKTQSQGGTGSHAASKASAYGGAEAGGIIGGIVGPPIVGNIVGGLVGERVGEAVAKETGAADAAGWANKKMAAVVGQRRADKVGEMALTAFGYSESEHCICCPCMPASQTLFFIFSAFFGFNIYRLVVGIKYDYNCTSSIDSSQVMSVPVVDENTTQTDNFWTISVNEERNETLYLVAYPCEFGFHYLLAGAAVWIAFLPFYICTLFGNCYRQCCCCLCDPIVCCATGTDFLKRCLCECGKFSPLTFIWSTVCIFHVVWACMAIAWLVKVLSQIEKDYRNYDANGVVVDTVLASLILDLLLAGSELVHKVRLHFVNKRNRELQKLGQENEDPAAQELRPINTR